MVITGEHSGLANLVPGNPGQVDPPSLEDATPATSGGTLAAGWYVYAVTDQFNTAAPGQTPVVSAGESAASISSPVQLTAAGSVTLTWGAVCHAGQYNVYRAPYTPGSGSSAGSTGAWSLIGTAAVNTDTDFINPSGNSTTSTAGGGAGPKTFTDTGSAGTLTGSTGTLSATTMPSTEGAAIESPYEQNPFLDAAFAATSGGGIKYFGADSSKPYPNPSDSAFATGSAPATQYAKGQTFQDAGATGIPRYPTNIYYNVSTNAQEIDEYQTLYDSPTCTSVTGVTTCNPAGTQFTMAQIVASADQGMFQHVMGNDPRPHYFHQTNLMSQTTGTVNGEGDGLYYQTMDPLLAEYQQYFAANAPIVQLTMPQIGSLLTEQANWAANTAVSGYIQGNQVTIANANSTASTVPLNGIPTVGSSYGGFVSGWTSVPAGTSTQTSSTTWPASQTITFTSTPPASPAVAGTYAVTATGGASGNPVVFSIDNSSTAGACSISGATVSFTAAGTCVIDANQAGNANYTAAPQAQQTVTIQAPQTITITSTAPAGAVVGGTYAVTATGGASGNPVDLQRSTARAPLGRARLPSGATAPATVSFTAAGTCVIDANQAANANYTAAPQAQQTVTIGQGSQTITFTSTPPASPAVGGTYAVTATGGASGNPVVFSIDNSSTAGACSISGATVSFTAARDVRDRRQPGQQRQLHRRAASATDRDDRQLAGDHQRGVCHVRGGCGRIVHGRGVWDAHCSSLGGGGPARGRHVRRQRQRDRDAGRDTQLDQRWGVSAHDHGQQRGRHHDPVVHLVGRLRSGDQFRELHELHRRPAGFVRGHHDRLPGTVAYEVRGVAFGGDFHRQRQRHSDHLRHPELG